MSFENSLWGTSVYAIVWPRTGKSGFWCATYSHFASLDRFHHFHHFRNRFAFFPGFVGGGWDWGYPYYDYAAYGDGCWRWDGWQWINVCNDYGGYNYGY